MPLPTYTLDDRTYQQLVDEAIQHIPSLEPAWTNFNPSDPGMMLLELAAWLTEMQIYRTERVPDASYWAFLRLLHGYGERRSFYRDLRTRTLDEAMRKTLKCLRQPFRAVTAADYATLVQTQWPYVPQARKLKGEGGIGQLKVIERCNCEPRAWQRREQDDHISLVIIPAARYVLTQEQPAGVYPVVLEAAPLAGAATLCVRASWSPADLPLHVEPVLAGAAKGKPPESGPSPFRLDLPFDANNLNGATKIHVRPLHGVSATAYNGELLIGIRRAQPSWDLRNVLWQWLDERRLLTVRHHVVGPEYLPLTIEATVQFKPELPRDHDPSELFELLERFFDPFVGGPDGRGWPLGQSTTVHTITNVLMGGAGVAGVKPLRVAIDGKRLSLDTGTYAVAPHQILDLQRVTINGVSKGAAR